MTAAALPPETLQATLFLPRKIVGSENCNIFFIISFVFCPWSLVLCPLVGGKSFLASTSGLADKGHWTRDIGQVTSPPRRLHIKKPGGDYRVFVVTRKCYQLIPKKWLLPPPYFLQGERFRPQQGMGGRCSQTAGI